jgi:hypothetical protein
MSFQDYCRKLFDAEEQNVSINNTFVIGFNNKNGKKFTIDPSDAINFMKFLDQSYTKCHTAWGRVESRKEKYTMYEGKSYRAIFQSAADDVNLVAISTLGGSQTSQLTRVISKLICYLGHFDYVGVEKNTYFDPDSVKKALDAVPVDLASLASTAQLKKLDDLEGRFRGWMRKNNLSEKTIDSYSVACVNLANQLLRGIDANFSGIFSISNLTILDEQLRKLDGDKEWEDRNVRGNGMYRAGLNKYREFLQDLNSTVILSLPKPFLLLAGISGTGKTRFVREQAAVHSGSYPSNFCLIPVRPDWHEPSDLLGYISRIGHDGARYVVTDLLRFVVKAWQDAADSATAADIEYKPTEKMTPYWLCLDEMNLAPVEQYFADYLSVLETRNWVDGNYSCDPLLKAATIQQLDTDGQTELRKQLGLGAGHDGLWQYFTTIGIPLPPNLIVAGTVNMDETTHGFSRKVIDRAFTIDFGVFFPNEFTEFFEPGTRPKVLGFPVLSHISPGDLAAVPADPGGTKSTRFLSAINDVLKTTPFELAYRALNELLLAVACFQPKDDAELQAVWDDFLMSKVLPRIDGDAEKLGVENDTSLLTKLRDEIVNNIAGKAETRPDLLREKTAGGGVCMVAWRAEQKLAWMQTRLVANGFTTFWP